MEAAYRVLRYLNRNPEQRILLRSDSELQVIAYCNFDWGACPLTRRSLTGYLVTLEGSPFVWKTNKSRTVSHSSTKAE